MISFTKPFAINWIQQIGMKEIEYNITTQLTFWIDNRDLNVSLKNTYKIASKQEQIHTIQLNMFKTSGTVLEIYTVENWLCS